MGSVEGERPEGSDLARYLERLAGLHPRLCPRQVLGVRMGLWAGQLLGLDLPRTDKRLLAFVETDGCFADGISVVTGCWLGRRTLRLVDNGKVAATLVDGRTARAVRLSPRPGARARAWDYAPGAADRWHAQLLGYQTMPVGELLRAQPVELTIPLTSLVGLPGRRAQCAACGEEVLNQRELAGPSGPLCVGCAGPSYYRPAHVTHCQVGTTVAHDHGRRSTWSVPRSTVMA